MYLLTTGHVLPPTSPHFGSLFAETRPEPAQVLSHELELATEIVGNVSLLAWHLNYALMWHNPGTAEESHVIDSTVIYHIFDGRYVFDSGSTGIARATWELSLVHADTFQGHARRV